MPHPSDWRRLKRSLYEAFNLNCTTYDAFFIELYEKNMSGPEISEYIERESGIKMTARSIQRIVGKKGKTRDIKTAFKIAIEKGRVVWQLEEDKKRREGARHQVSKKLRYEILKRDEFKCVLCGAKELLQIDHKIAQMNGGDDSEQNLRTLCIDCNTGKALAEGERRNVGHLRSGKEERVLTLKIL